MEKYYYLLSSLPYLDLHKYAPLSYVDLLVLSTPWLSPHDQTQLESARIDIESVSMKRVTHGTLRDWILFEHNLRNQLVELRAEKLGIRASPHLRTHIAEDPTVVPSLIQIAEDPSPYEAELALLEIRWHFLTDQEVGHYFDLAALIIFALKLQLLDRKKKFESEKGRQVIQSIIKVNLGDGGEVRDNSGR